MEKKFLNNFRMFAIGVHSTLIVVGLIEKNLSIILLNTSLLIINITLFNSSNRYDE
jgi:hypothetical protein